MTWAEREQILSKDYLDGDDVSALLGVDKITASTILAKIRRSGCDRLGIRGKIHVQAYIDFFHLPQDRFIFSPIIRKEGETTEQETEL